MNNRQRFNNIMNYRDVDRILYFEEGIRKEVLKKWGIKKWQSPEIVLFADTNFRQLQV